MSNLTRLQPMLDNLINVLKSKLISKWLICAILRLKIQLLGMLLKNTEGWVLENISNLTRLQLMMDNLMNVLKSTLISKWLIFAIFGFKIQ